MTLRPNLLSVLCTLISKHFTIDTLTYMPIHHGLGIVGCSCQLTTSLLNNLAQVLHQGLRIILLYLLNIHISYGFLVFLPAKLQIISDASGLVHNK